jgi:hypothetical protein
MQTSVLLVGLSHICRYLAFSHSGSAEDVNLLEHYTIPIINQNGVSSQMTLMCFQPVNHNSDNSADNIVTDTASFHKLT